MRRLSPAARLWSRRPMGAAFARKGVWRNLALLLSLSFPATALAEKPRTAIVSSLVLKVADRNQTADFLIAEAEKVGGYFSIRTDDQVTLKIPVEYAEAFVAKTDPLGKVVDRTYEAQDVGATLAELRTRLKSRQQVFQRYFAVLSTAGHRAVVEVESQMTELVQEIENLKGSIRLIEHQLQYATLTVRFELPDRRAPVRDGRSSFAWLNTVNLSDLLAEFAHAL